MAERDDVLITENEAKNKINQILQEKDSLFKQAKQNARKDLSSYEDEIREETRDKITTLNMNQDEFDAIEKRTEEEIKEIEALFVRNKETVIDMLFKNVIAVNVEVPDVVKGDFEKNIKL